MELLIKPMSDKIGTLIPFPYYATSGAAAMDLSACLDDAVSLAPGERAIIPTGISMSIPPKHVGLLFARSGLAIKEGLALINGVGVIDSDYRGEVKVGLINLSGEQRTIQHGQRIAQMAIMPVTLVHPVEVDELDDTTRGTGGLGSTGI